MSDEGGSVTLVFYRIGTGTDLFKEPFLNIVAAAFQMSSFTHVEIAIGNEAGSMGQMSNVCRIFNDDVGVRASYFEVKTSQFQFSHSFVCCAGRVDVQNWKEPTGMPVPTREAYKIPNTDMASGFVAVLLFVARLLKEGRAGHAQLRAFPCGQAFFKHWDGALNTFSEAHYRRVFLLRRCAVCKTNTNP
jgi:hypothetical protein